MALPIRKSAAAQLRFNTRVPPRMESALFTEVVEALLCTTGSRTTGVCTLVGLNLRNLRFLLRVFRVAGAEGGLISNTLFLPFLLRVLIFLGKPRVSCSAPFAPSVLSAPQLYLSCSELWSISNS